MVRWRRWCRITVLSRLYADLQPAVLAQFKIETSAIYVVGIAVVEIRSRQTSYLTLRQQTFGTIGKNIDAVGQPVAGSAHQAE